MKIRRNSTPRPPGSSHPVQVAGVVALVLAVLTALALVAATGRL
ncbi:MAG: hypothetical protein WBQ44_21085 [Rhodococcus sp. (in: high G+C Gram-positive bacteria)]